MSQPVVSAAIKPVAYDGVLAGLLRHHDACDGLSPEQVEAAGLTPPEAPNGWSFEGVAYDTPASESDVVACANEALEAPDARSIEAARKLTFGPGVTYTAQALLAIEAAYVAEVGDDGDGTPQILAILREAARRIACIEALTI